MRLYALQTLIIYLLTSGQASALDEATTFAAERCAYLVTDRFNDTERTEIHVPLGRSGKATVLDVFDAAGRYLRTNTVSSPEDDAISRNVASIRAAVPHDAHTVTDEKIATGVDVTPTISVEVGIQTRRSGPLLYRPAKALNVYSVCHKQRGCLREEYVVWMDHFALPHSYTVRTAQLPPRNAAAEYAYDVSSRQVRHIVCKNGLKQTQHMYVPWFRRVDGSEVPIPASVMDQFLN